MDIYEFTKLINGSLRYEIHDGILTLTGYYTGNQIQIDLSKITPEMLEEITVTVEDDEDDSDDDLEWWQK